MVVPAFTQEQLDYLNGLDNPAWWAAGVASIMVLDDVSFDDALAALYDAKLKDEE